MSAAIRIRLEPLGEVVRAERGATLREILLPFGVEFPCAGRGRCRRCRIRVLNGELTGTPEERQILTEAERQSGWRLACRCTPTGELTLEIGQWEAEILSDHTRFEFQPREGLGLAIDLGTTTLVAQLLDLETGNVLAVRTALNPQGAWGSDVMSRIHAAVAEESAAELTAAIRTRLGEMIVKLCEGTQRKADVRDAVIVGNTVMHHLFCGIDLEPLSYYPFEASRDGLEEFGAGDLGWDLPAQARVSFLPCLGGFVGSDILAGILALGVAESESRVGLIDLGTNGEIVLGSREGIVCASTAAGPAFEGGRISMGMRAGTGAISGIRVADGALRCEVVGDVAPRGICGSGLVDAVAAGLDLGTIGPDGRLAEGRKSWRLTGPITLSQRDVRELQLAKGAVAAGARILLRHLGLEPGAVTALFLGGAFGNYVDRESAARIGLLEIPLDRVESAGNTALLGAKLVLFQAEDADRDYTELRQRIRHVPLASDSDFEETYIEAMRFPAGTPSA
jgi:uncharacterized 2Fe-2S/4Fe-4S cluster protein (DUF4445 family)